MNNELALNKLAFRVFGSVDENEPIEFKICNISSLCFYVIQCLYSCFLLYRLVRKTPKKPMLSKSMIVATVLIIYSSAVLAILFGLPRLAIEGQDSQHLKDSIGLRFYLIMCRDVPFTLIFIAHLIIFNVYYELALILDVLVDMGHNWMEAENKLISKRSCLRAMTLIVGAMVVAHLLFKSFYTLVPASQFADISSNVFASGMHVLLTVLCVFAGARINRIVRKEQFLQINMRLWMAHIIILGTSFLF